MIFRTMLIALFFITLQKLNAADSTGNYNKTMTDILQTVFGERILSPGGVKKLNELCKGIDLCQKKVLDFGCGLGGYAIHLAENYKAIVTGVDIDPILIQEAQKNRLISKMSSHLTFISLDEKDLTTVQDRSFDVIFSKEVILHVADKTTLFREFNRILKPDGIIIIDDWCHKSSLYGSDMKQFVLIDGLDFNLCSKDDYYKALKDAGFSNILVRDTSLCSLRETQETIDCLKTGIGDKLQQKMGQHVLDYCLESWKLQSVVLQQGELQTFHIVAKKAQEFTKRKINLKI